MLSSGMHVRIEGAPSAGALSNMILLRLNVSGSSSGGDEGSTKVNVSVWEHRDRSAASLSSLPAHSD